MATNPARKLALQGSEAAIGDWVDKVVSHARLEEETIFPEARAALTADENAALTRHMNWEGLKAA